MKHIVKFTYKFVNKMSLGDNAFSFETEDISKAGLKKQIEEKIQALEQSGRIFIKDIWMETVTVKKLNGVLRD